MADNGAIQTMVEQSAQSRFKDDLDGTGSGIATVLTGLIRAGELLPPWWSRQRDLELFRMFLQSDALQSAEYRMRTKLASVQPRVVPRDSNIKSSIALAEEFNTILYENWELGQGWQVGFEKDLTDLLTRDNGFFREITGDGPKDQPIVGMPTGSISLDSTRCTRTGNPIYPVVYQDTDGSRYKFHYSRVMFGAQSPSTLATMKGVGRCWVTRCVNIAQNLIDISIYEQEKLGSRPLRQILIGSGITAQQIWDAVYDAEESMDNAGLRRFSKAAAVGSQTGEVDIKQLVLTSVPDGFDKRTSTEIGMFIMALAAGVPPRDLWPASTTGATKADAESQHTSGAAGYQAVLNLFSFLIGGSPYGNRQNIRGKFLPPTLRLEFDFVDDEQDSRHAQNSSVRAQTRERDLADGIITVRVGREQALSASDLTQSQFEELELGDGRLPDGTSVLNLFLTTDLAMQRLLDISTPNPLDVEANRENTDFILEQIRDALLLANMQALNASTTRLKQMAKQAARALTELERIYSEPEPASPTAPNTQPDQEQATDNGAVTAEEEDANPVSAAVEEDQEEKGLYPLGLSDQDIISLAPYGAQKANYRRVDKADMLAGRRCGTCFFNERDNACDNHNFPINKGFTCDNYRNRTTGAVLRQAYR